MNDDYYMTNIRTGEKFFLKEASRPSIKVSYKTERKIKYAKNIKWNPVIYKYATLIL